MPVHIGLHALVVRRYCSWHILHKLPQKWGGNVPNKETLTQNVKDVVYLSQTISEFEQNWTNLFNRIGYDHNPWFSEIYEIREKWVPAYLNNKFWAGMTSTQRVESMNNFLNKYLRKRECLGEFVVNFEQALKKIWENEHESDFKTKYAIPKQTTELPMEVQLLERYTNRMFYMCQDQFKAIVNFTCRLKLELDESTRFYDVFDVSGKIYEVQYNQNLKEVKCICRLFEFSKLVCVHCILVLKQENEVFLNNKYIVNRWRKDINRLDLRLAATSDVTSPEHTR